MRSLAYCLVALLCLLVMPRPPVFTHTPDNVSIVHRDFHSTTGVMGAVLNLPTSKQVMDMASLSTLPTSSYTASGAVSSVSERAQRYDRKAASGVDLLSRNTRLTGGALGALPLRA